MKKTLKSNFKDKRGRIIDIFVKKPKDHCSLVTFNKGAIRGNHFHKKTIQYAFVLEGKILAKSKKVGMNLEEVTLEPGDLISHDFYEAHMFEALVDSKFLVLSSGLRTGKDYELDTFRLSSLIEDFSEADIK